MLLMNRPVVRIFDWLVSRSVLLGVSDPVSPSKRRYTEEEEEEEKKEQVSDGRFLG